MWMSQGPDTSGPGWVWTYRTTRARHLRRTPPSLGWSLLLHFLLVLLAPLWNQERLDTDRKIELSCCLMEASFKSPGVAPAAGSLDPRLGSGSTRWRILLGKMMTSPPPMMMTMRLLAQSTPLSRALLPIEEINLHPRTPVHQGSPVPRATSNIQVIQVGQVTHLIGTGG